MEAEHEKRGPFLVEISVVGGKDEAEGNGEPQEAFAEDLWVASEILQA